MTCPLPRNVIDGALDGLALVEASVESNPVNRRMLLANVDAYDLIVGLVVLVSSLRQSLAVAYRTDTDQVSELLRGMLLAAEVAS